MSEDLIRYDLLAQEALRGLVKKVLADAAKYGLPGEHHFFVTFETDYPGVKIPNRLREKFPETMTIALQHQFRDLQAHDKEFEVGLSFGGVPERLRIPYGAIREFVDPSVKFGLQFETLDTTTEDGVAAPAANAEKAESGEQPISLVPTERSSAPDANSPSSGSESGSAEVVSLDKFRKK